MADPTHASCRRLVWLLAVLLLVIFSSIFYDFKSGLVAQPGASQVEKKLEQRKQLPSLKNGGIVFFLHVPKVGGTTIRELIKYQRGGRRSKVNYIYLTGPREYDYAVENMNEWVVHGTGTIEDKHQVDPVGQVVFIEYHALDRECPTFLKMRSQLREWKEQAKEHNVPFFAFAILREPLSLSVSFHNFYFRIPQNPKRFDLIEGENATEESFLERTMANPQCLFLGRNEDAYTKTGQDLRATLTREECREAYDEMHELMDWVGTTERIRNETLPLLKELFQSNQYTKRLIRNLNKTANPSAAGTSNAVRLANLSDAAIEYVESVTIWDKELYDSVKRDFSYHSWGLG